MVEVATGPKRHLSLFDAVCVVVGIVVGAGIFKAPRLVALNTASSSMMLLAWAVGGFLCLCGALCYAELATAYPRVGGEYVFLSKSFGGMTGGGMHFTRVHPIARAGSGWQ